MEKKPISHFIAGVIVAGLIIIYTIILYFTGMQTNQAMGWVSYAILIVGIMYFVQAYGKANNYHLTFGNLFAYGFKSAAFSALIVIAFSVIFNLIFPEFKEKIFETARQNMEAQGKYTDDQINTGMEVTRKFFMVFIIAGSLFFFAIFGAIGSLIGAAITKKIVSESPFENQK
jgi:Protein of unknown function (DUF4199)